jgi:hypothetical protein
MHTTLLLYPRIPFSPALPPSWAFPLSKKECNAARNGPHHLRTGRHTPAGLPRVVLDGDHEPDGRSLDDENDDDDGG